MLDFQDQRVCTDDLLERIREIFKGHKTLISGFNDFLPEDCQIILSEDEIAISFVNKVKRRFEGNHRGFESFMHILDMYALDKISIIEVYKEVAFLFQSHDDLFLEFKTYLPHTSIGVKGSSPQPIHVRKRQKIEDNDATQFRSRMDNSVFQGGGIHGQEFAFFEKVKDSNSDVHQLLMKYMELYNIKIITHSELQNMVDDLLEHYPKLLNGFNNIFKSSVNIGSEELNKNGASGGEDATPSKVTRKSIREIDFSKCEQVTPSYRLLPEDFPVVIPTERTTIAKMVLNDRYVCVSPGNGVYCKKKSIEAFKEKLIQLEDARFEMDLLMGCLKSTVEGANEMLELINKDTFGANHAVFLEHYFTDRMLSCIEKLFGDWGLEVLDLLRENASGVLPIILSRLLQKSEELVQYRICINACADSS